MQVQLLSDALSQVRASYFGDKFAHGQKLSWCVLRGRNTLLSLEVRFLVDHVHSNFVTGVLNVSGFSFKFPFFLKNLGGGLWY